MASNAVLDCIYARRSVRSYSIKPVTDDIVREVIKAGFHAPNGLNLQKLRFSVVTNKAKLKTFSDSGKKLYLQYMKEIGFSSPFLEGELNNPNYNLFYDAPVAIFIFAAPGILAAGTDASLAAENMMIAATSFGLGSCYVGMAAGLAKDKDFMNEVNVPQDHTMKGVIILGYTKNDPGPSQRAKPQILSWIN